MNTSGYPFKFGDRVENKNALESDPDKRGTFVRIEYRPPWIKPAGYWAHVTDGKRFWLALPESLVMIDQAEETTQDLQNKIEAMYDLLLGHAGMDRPEADRLLEKMR